MNAQELFVVAVRIMGLVFFYFALQDSMDLLMVMLLGAGDGLLGSAIRGNASDLSPAFSMVLRTFLNYAMAYALLKYGGQLGRWIWQWDEHRPPGQRGFEVEAHADRGP